MRGVVSLEGDSLVVFYYLSAYEILYGLWWERPYKRGITVS